MLGSKGAIADETTLELLRTIVEECWNALPRDKRVSKDALVKRIMDAAQRGVSDPQELRSICIGED